MVIASAQSDDRDVLLLGLSRENLERLQAGMPIRITRESHGMAVPERLSIFIIAGEDEPSIERDLRKAGLIGPSTVLNQRTPA